MPEQIRVYQGDRIATIPLSPAQGITFGDGEGADYRFPEGSCEGSGLRFYSQNGVWQAVSRGLVLRGGMPFTGGAVHEGDMFILSTANRIAVQLLHEGQTESLSAAVGGLPEVLIGRAPGCAVELMEKRVSGSHAKLYRLEGEWRVCDTNSSNGTFLNGKRITDAPIRSGDVITAGSYELRLTGDRLTVSGGAPGTVRFHLPSAPQTPPAQGSGRKIAALYPRFSRSPRIRREIPSGKIEIEAAPSIGEKPEINWLTTLLPVFGTLAVSLLLSLFTAGLGMILSVPMVLIGVLVTFLNYRGQTKKYRHNESELREKYRQYIQSCEARLSDAARAQRDALLDANPAPEQCLRLAAGVDRRLWEKTAGDNDFLCLRAGVGQEPLCVEVVTPKVGFVLQENDYTRLPEQTAEKYRLADGIPVCCDLRRAPTLGIVGNRAEALRALRALLVQAAALHGYDELKIALFFPQDELPAWEWARWLPHARLGNRRLLACTRYDAAQLLGPLEKELARRAADSAKAWGGTAQRLPHFLFVVADPSLLSGQPAADTLLSGNPALGVSCVLLGRELSELPGSVQQILTANGADSTLMHRDAPGEKRRFAMDALDEKQCDAFARALSPIRLPEKTESARLPDSVTFLEGYRIRRPEELDIDDFWNSSCSWRSLAAPIGVRAGGTVFSFDIHEKHSGPHGLVAGTNGSGKSEMAQSWIASMALQFSPRDVNFVLVDFKGTSLLQPFRALPHLAGSISNLDKDIQRCLMALDNEIERRQLLVDRYGAHDILGYQAMRKRNPDMEEMPFLILVIDEFADFKAQYPDFTGPLNHIFRGGRALGIYTVIMTQKPAGVVTEQMYANACFRWCLKVMSESDSREMLGVGDAAYLTQPGRAYVRSGTGVPELVQPFYSGAPYYPDGQPKKAGPAVARVLLTGERQTIGAPARNTGPRARGTQLEAVVRAIADHCRRRHIAPARQIWNAPLPEKLDLVSLLPGGKLWESPAAWEESAPAPAACLGLIDDPANQRQTPLLHDFWQNGHLLLYGMPLSGKTTFLQTLLVSLCCRYSPAQAQLYLAEFGAFGLRALEHFPHVGGAAGDDEPDQMKRILALFSEELDRRKQLFRKAGVGSISALAEAGDETPPSWILAVDNLNQAASKLPEFLEALERIAQEGESFGLYVAAAVTGASSPGYRLAANFKTVLTLQLTDRTDYSQFVGRVQANIPKPVLGRGLVRGPLEFQTAIAFADFTDGKRAAALRQLAEEMDAAWKGPRPKSVRALPQDIPYGSLEGEPLLLGLSCGEIVPVSLPLAETTSLLVSAGDAGSLDAFYALLLRQLGELPDADVLLCSPTLSLDSARVVREPERLNDVLGELVPELQARRDAHKKDASLRFSPIVIVVDGLASVIERAEQKAVARLEVFIRLGEGIGVTVIGADTANNAELAYFSQNILMETLHEGPMLLMGGSPAEHRIADAQALSRQFPQGFAPDQMVLARGGAFTAVKRMRADG